MKITVVDIPDTLPSKDQTLTPVQLEVLAAIVDYCKAADEPCPASILARKFQRNRSTICQHFEALYRKGWLETPNSPVQIPLSKRSRRTVTVADGIHLQPGHFRFIREYLDEHQRLCVDLTIDNIPLRAAVAMAHDALDRAKHGFHAREARQRAGRESAARRQVQAQQEMQAIERMKKRNPRLSDEGAGRTYLQERDPQSWHATDEWTQNKLIDGLKRRLSRARRVTQ